LPKRKKKVKAAFWKKSPEIQRIADHVGKFIDRVDPKGISDMVLKVGVSYMGYKAFGNRWEGAIVGLAGMSLAQVPAGAGSSMKVYSPLFGIDIPMNSQTVGLGILAAIGIGTFVLPHINYEWIHSKEAVPPTEEEIRITKKMEAGETLTPEEELYLKQRAMKRLVLS